MANKQLFRRDGSNGAPVADTVNEAGGRAYSMEPQLALAQYAATGTLNQTFYASAEDQLERTLHLCAKVDPAFIAKVAVYSREQSFMKDMPALLCAVLAAKGETELLKSVFPRVIDNGKMLRNFVQIIRSGKLGRKSFGTSVKKMIQRWFETRTDEQVFRNSVGSDPSMGDIIKMTHPTPGSKSRASLFRYLIGKDFEKRGLPKERDLPDVVKAFEKMKAGELGIVEQQFGIPFEMLTSLKLRPESWVALTRIMSWTQLRMNLNTLQRHGVFEEKVMIKFVADRLRDAHSIKKARCFPFQLLAAFKHVEYSMPSEITLALQDAMEIATENIPAFDLPGGIFVFPDISGSMKSTPATGVRKGATSKVTALDVAALVSACVLRKNPHAEVVPFHDVAVRNVRLNPRDSVMTNAQVLAQLESGGTNCSAPLRMLNAENLRADLVIYISDNQSWVDSVDGYYGKGTGVASEWQRFKRRNPAARLVCIDVQPYDSVQQQDRPDSLNIGGFSDNVFEVIARFARGGGEHWVEEIERYVEVGVTSGDVPKPEKSNGKSNGKPGKPKKPRKAKTKKGVRKQAQARK